MEVQQAANKGRFSKLASCGYQRETRTIN